MLGQRTLNRQKSVPTAIDPSAVFVVKSLLYPIAAVVTLAVCLVIWGEPLYGPYVLVAVLAFLGTADFLDIAPLHGRGQSLFGSLFDIACRWALVIGFIWILIHLSDLSRRYSSDVLLAWAMSTPIVLWLSEIASRHIFLHLGFRYQQPRRAVVLGVTALGARLESVLHSDPLLHTKVVGFFDPRSHDSLPQEYVGKVVGLPEDLPSYVLEHRIDIVYITLPMTSEPRLMRVLDALRDSTASVYFLPDVFAFGLIQARLDLVHGIPMFAVRESPFFGVRGLLKRLCDIMIAGLAILILSPILLAIAIGVKVNLPGSIIFKQRRYGLDGKEIVVYKFRSMTVTEDGAQTYTQVAREDARVTAFGRFIRKTSLDELPQLFNVLEGSMSIVGPRPHAIAVNEQYRRLIPSYMLRHKVKPGITGWAQINGYRGGDDLDSMRKRIDFDLEYLNRWSLTLDLTIILKTLAIVWNDRRAY